MLDLKTFEKNSHISHNFLMDKRWEQFLISLNYYPMIMVFNRITNITAKL